MALYCTLTEANALIPTQEFDANSHPSYDQALAIVGNVSHELDALLISRGWTLPVTDTEMLGFLKVASEYGAAAILLRARFPAAEGIGGEGGAARAFENRYLELKRLLLSEAFAPYTFVGESDLFGSGFPDPDQTEDEHDKPFVTRHTEF